MTAEWNEGYVRRRTPRPAPFKRYTDHDELLAWIDQHGSFQGMYTIATPHEGVPPLERWHLNGQMVELRAGQYLVLEGFSFRAYDPDQMERFFELTEEDE